MLIQCEAHALPDQLYRTYGTIRDTSTTNVLQSHLPLGVFPATFVKHRKRADTPSLCTTQACTEYAKSVVSNISPKYTAVDPCQNFEEYVCGGFKQTHDYRPEQSSVSSRSAMMDVTRTILQSILEGSYNDSSTISGANSTARKANFEKLKTAHSTCMDEESIKQAGTAPLRELLNELDVYYPATTSNSSSPSSKDELTNALIWLSKNSVAVLVGRLVIIVRITEILMLSLDSSFPCS
jgi:endothelin-converting enzyme